MISHSEAKEKAGSGWFDVWMSFEGVAINADVIRSALEGIVERMDGMTSIKVYDKGYLEPVKVENPMKGVKEAWSQVVNVKLVSRSFSDLVALIIEFGPSSVEVMSPPKKEMNVSEAQDILNNVAAMMHRFAAAGVGGAIVVRSKV